MKILHVIPNLRFGGAERLCIDVCSELARKGHEVVIVLFENSIEFEDNLSGVTIEVIPSSFQASFIRPNQINNQGLKEFILDFKPDVIHSHLYEADLILFSINEIIKTKVISHTHCNRDILIKKYKTRNCKQKLISISERRHYIKKLNKFNVKHIAISDSTSKFLKFDLQRCKSDFILLPNSINFKKFEGLPKTIEGKSKFKIISVGRFFGYKGHLFLLEVTNLLLQKGMNIHLTFVGDGVERKNIEQKISQLSLQESVHITGYSNEVEKHLKSSDLYVHAATTEAFGLVLVEAMAAGLPVISTDGGGNRDVIVESKNGFMIWDRDPNKFAESVFQLLGNKNKYKEISKYSIEYASNYDVVKYCSSLEEFYMA